MCTLQLVVALQCITTCYCITVHYNLLLHYSALQLVVPLQCITLKIARKTVLSQAYHQVRYLLQRKQFIVEENWDDEIFTYIEPSSIKKHYTNCKMYFLELDIVSL